MKKTTLVIAVSFMLSACGGDSGSSSSSVGGDIDGSKEVYLLGTSWQMSETHSDCPSVKQTNTVSYADKNSNNILDSVTVYDQYNHIDLRSCELKVSNTGTRESDVSESYGFKTSMTASEYRAAFIKQLKSKNGVDESSISVEMTDYSDNKIRLVLIAGQDTMTLTLQPN